MSARSESDTLGWVRCQGGGKARLQKTAETLLRIARGRVSETAGVARAKLQETRSVWTANNVVLRDNGQKCWW